MPWVPRSGEDFPSLGWGVVEWAEERLRLSSTPDVPLVLYREQVEWFVRWFRIDAETGMFVYSSGVFIGPQGIGKSPAVGGIGTLAQLRGPVVFDGWDSDGQPVGVPLRDAWCQIWSQSEDLTTNMYEPARWMAEDAQNRGVPGFEHVDAGETRIKFKGADRARVEFKAQAVKPGEQINGGAALDETGFWLPAKSGPGTARMVRSNAEKTFVPIGLMSDPRSVDSPGGGRQPARVFSVSNQPLFGEGSVAESEMTELAKDDDFLLFELSGLPVKDPKDPEQVEQVRKSLRKSHGSALLEDGGHMPLESRVAACYSSKYDSVHVKRFFLSLRVRGLSKGLTPFCDVESEWRPLEERRDLLVGEPVVLAIDPSRSQDSTMLRAWACGDGGDVLPYTWRDPEWAWVRPPQAEDWSVSSNDVLPFVRHAVESLNVVAIAFDPNPWNYDFGQWEANEFGALGEGGLMLEINTNQASRFGPMVDEFLSAMRSGGFRHGGNVWGYDHLANAVKGKKGQFTTVTKQAPDSPLKIDDVITMVAGWSTVQGFWSGDWEGSVAPFWDVVF